MCLTIEPNSKRMTAKKDIVVYKALAIEQHGLEIYGTPPFFISYSYRKGATSRSRLIKDISTDRSYREVRVGLHSFHRRNSAAMAMMGTACSIVEMIIPKGAQYYVGKFRDKKAYASNKLYWPYERRNI